MAQRVVVKGGHVIDPAIGVDGVLDVLITGGMVAAIEREIDTAGADVVDARGKLVVAGLVDIHAHLREPGFEQKGTISTETAAALRGGFTTVCAMPNTEPAPDNASTVESLLERIDRDAAVRVFPIGCVTRGRAGERLAEISELADAGCVALSDDGNPVADPLLFRNALLLASAAGLVLTEHSDDPVLGNRGIAHDGRISERLGLRGHPAGAEIHAVARNIELAAATGARLHLAHLSCERSVELVADAKARGIAVTCEVTPSHLLLTEDAVFGDGPEPLYDTNARINPPLRSERDRRALIEGLNQGVVDAIATDHAPHAFEDKQCEFDVAAPGISCLETAAATVLTLIARGELDLRRAVAALTAGPVSCFALDRRVPGLGSLRPGEAADLVLLDPEVRWRVDPTSFRSKGRNTPLAGTELIGRPDYVFTRGVGYDLRAAAGV